MARIEPDGREGLADARSANLEAGLVATDFVDQVDGLNDPLAVLKLFEAEDLEGTQRLVEGTEDLNAQEGIVAVVEGVADEFEVLAEAGKIRRWYGVKNLGGTALDLVGTDIAGIRPVSKGHEEVERDIAYAWEDLLEPRPRWDDGKRRRESGIQVVGGESTLPDMGMDAVLQNQLNGLATLDALESRKPGTHERAGLAPCTPEESVEYSGLATTGHVLKFELEGEISSETLVAELGKMVGGLLR